MSTLGTWIREGMTRLDAGLPAWTYGAVSIDVDRYRERLAVLGWAHLHPSQPETRLADADRTAARVIASARTSAVTLGAVGGAGGALSLGPEAAGWVVVVLRLAQRLAVVYGLDPRTLAGRNAVERAIAQAFNLPMPSHGLAEARATELLRPLRGARSTGLARQVAGQVARRVTRRLGRWVPVVSVAVSALDNEAEIARAGQRMVAVLRVIAEGPGPDREAALDAIEVLIPR